MAPTNLKKLLIPAFCLLHMIAVFWWTLPHSFGSLVAATSAAPDSLEAQLFRDTQWAEDSKIAALLRTYIDATGSQQYWDFFAPFSPRYHQYLSVCAAVQAFPEQGAITCKDQPWFSNLDADFGRFRILGSGRSRWYRLTENLTKLEDPDLWQTFARYYRNRNAMAGAAAPARLVLHQFELHPELADLPSGYRMDSVLWEDR